MRINNKIETTKGEIGIIDTIYPDGVDIILDNGDCLELEFSDIRMVIK